MSTPLVVGPPSDVSPSAEKDRYGRETASATATLRAVFAMMPTGLAAVATSVIAAKDTPG
jgi:hypothetical protein